MKKIIGFFTGFGISELGTVLFLFVVFFTGMFFIVPSLFFTALHWLVTLIPLWLPVVAVFIFWNLWIRYVQAQFIASQKYTVLEVRIPREIDKSPKAMEAVFDGIHIGIGETTFINRWFEGKVRTWYSFELASIGGRIHFYIWTRDFFKDIIEAQIYAQYPEVEIYEVEDYASKFNYDPTKHKVWGSDFKLDKDDVLPIKTYIDYELDRDPKEEFKIDPIAHLFEYLSTIKEGEQAWIQIIIRTNKDKRRKKGTWFKKEDKWSAEAKDKIAEIKEEATIEMESIMDPSIKVKGTPILLPGQREKIDAIERTASKKAYDAGIRVLHIGPRDNFRGINTVGLLGVFKQFASSNLNSLAPTRWFIGFSYPWEDFRNMRQERLMHKILDAYRRRSWFFPPYETPHFVLTTEELATIYHFPSRGVQAPGLSRIPSTKSEAPPNLPI